MNRGTFKLKSEDGKELFIYEWLPDDGNTKAVIQISHGMAEHAGRYEEFARRLTLEGYAVYANDHRGHGQTAGDIKNIGYFANKNGWNLVVKDMYTITNYIKEKWSKYPIFLFGHSMGSLLSRHYIYQYGNILRGVILSGTSGNPGILANIGKLLARMECKFKGGKNKSINLDRLTFGSYNKAFRPSRTPFDWLSRDSKEVDKYINNPLCGEIFSSCFFYDLLTGIKLIHNKKNIKRIPKNLPIFFISGEKDPVGNNTKGVLDVYRVYKKMGIKDVQYKFYNDARHELLKELNREQVMKDIILWLNKHLK